MKKRFMASVLAVAMVLTMLTGLAFASDGVVAFYNGTGYTTVQSAIEVATSAGGDVTVTLAAGTITENISITQTKGVNLTLTGDESGSTLKGKLTISGRSDQDSSETLTIQNINFVNVDDASTASIYVPAAGDRYSHNVTISGCSFTNESSAATGVAAVRQATGGCVNWKIEYCTVDSTMHSLAQINNVAEGLVIDHCTVESKNGVNLNSTIATTITNSTFDVKGYAIRVGVSGSSSVAPEVNLNNNIISTEGEDGDTAIIVRGTATETKVKIEDTQFTGNGATISFTFNDTTGVKIEADSKIVQNADGSMNVVNEGFSVCSLEQLLVALREKPDEIKVTERIMITGDVTLSSEVPVTITANAGLYDLFTVENGTLTLGEKITVEHNSSILYANGGNIVVDGANLITTNSPYSTAYVDNGSITVKSGSIVSNGQDSGGKDHPALEAKGSNATVNINGGTVKASSNAVIANVGSTVNITDGEIESTAENRYTVWAWGGTLNISGGIFTAKNNYDCVDADANNTTAASVSITGGTFGSDVSKYYDTEKYEQNANGEVVEKDTTPDNTPAPITPVITTYTVTAAAGEGGSITPAGSWTVAEGTVMTFTATPAGAHEIRNVLINGESVGTDAVITLTVTADTTIEVVFGYINSFIDDSEDTAASSRPSAYEKWLELYAGSLISYTDVLPADWFYNNVTWAWNRNLLDNTRSLEPNANATRATIVEWIWRMEGRPVVYGVAFDDTSAMSAAWAASVGIVNGYGNGKFGPDDLVTREQLAAILYRYAQYKGVNTSARGDLSRFSDAARISGYAVEPMQWAVGVAMINGYPNGTVQPQGNATRAEVITLLNRMSVNFGL